MVLHEELRVLPEPLEETLQPPEAELMMIRKWGVALLPWQTDFIPVPIKLDPLNKSLIDRGLLLGNAEGFEVPEAFS